MSESYLPTYTERPGEQVFRPPYVAEGVRLHVCFVRAGVEKLNELIDGSLNAALESRSHGAPRFRATGQPIIFMFAEIAKMYSAADDYLAKRKSRQTGTTVRARDLARTLTGRPFVPEVELGIWVPISRLVYGRQWPGFYLPFVFNGTPASVVTGREVYGYPKQLAAFDRRDPSPEPLKSVKLATWHLPPDELEYKQADLLTMTLSSDTSSDPRGRGGWKAAVASCLRDYKPPEVPRVRFRAPGSRGDVPDGGDQDAGWNEFVDQMVKGAPLCFLRQFRDPVNPPDATVQQIISAQFVIQSTPRFWIYPDNGGQIAVKRSDTLDLIKILGLEHTDRTVPIQSMVVIDQLAFTVDLGKVLA
jgi:hypothetical protein